MYKNVNVILLKYSNVLVTSYKIILCVVICQSKMALYIISSILLQKFSCKHINGFRALYNLTFWEQSKLILNLLVSYEKRLSCYLLMSLTLYEVSENS